MVDDQEVMVVEHGVDGEGLVADQGVVEEAARVEQHERIDLGMVVIKQYFDAENHYVRDYLSYE